MKRGVLWAVGAAFVHFLLAGCRGSTTPDTARARRSPRLAKLCATPGCRRIHPGDERKGEPNSLIVCGHELCG